MNYATQHHIGNNQYTRTETTTAVTPTVGRVRKLATKTKGRKPSAERQAEIRTDSNATNGILKCTFLPKLKNSTIRTGLSENGEGFLQVPFPTCRALQH